MINFVSLDSKLIFMTYDQASAVRDGSVAEADCGNGCQDCQDYSSQDETRAAWPLIGWLWAELASDWLSFYGNLYFIR